MDILVFSLLIVAVACGLFLLGVAALLMLPIFLFMVVAMAIYEYRGVEYVRRRFGRLEFPVVTFVNPKSGKRVRLISVIHIAEPRYWNEIESYVKRFASSTVLYELISRPTDGEIESFTKLEQRVWRHMNESKRFVEGMVQLLGLRYQREGLSYPPGWVRTDMDGVDLIRLFAANDALHPKRARRKYANNEPLAVEKQRKVLKWLLHKLIGHMPVISHLITLVEQDPYLARQNEIILDMRNAIGAQAIIERSCSNDVVSIWGARHLPGIRELLLEEGLVIEKKEWLTAWTPTEYSIIDALQGDE